MQRRLLQSLATASLVLLTGCVQFPVIESQKLAPVKTVAIVDVPEVRHVAWLGVYLPEMQHFRPSQDMFFLDKSADTVPKPPEARAGEQAATTSLPPNPSNLQIGTAVVVGALLDASAQSTIKESQNYHNVVMARVPGNDLRQDFMSALRSALEARGYQVSIIDDKPPRSPRLRWPAPNGNDFVRAIPTNAADIFPAVDADLVLQVSPVAMHMAPGGLNAYSAKVSVGTAIYNGRTKEFLGMQVFKADMGKSPSYSLYRSLVDDIPKSVDSFRDGLSSLVPKIVEALPPVKR